MDCVMRDSGWFDIYKCKKKKNESKTIYIMFVCIYVEIIICFEFIRYKFW